ncbi:coagulation factor VII [Denticeps clupeoides]|uniref:coagulation factor VII n=1 Tax=Denticeps clupeoides TaxID=299321 RepID=UPI0010A3FC20|nr:coagulation factor VII-like [Denticeps clupeoides]
MESEAQKVKTCLPVLVFLLVIIFTPSSGLPGVFLNRPDANQVLLQRTRRANSIFEELKVGDLERECLEEKCSYEEAREIFSIPEQLNDFWRRYSEMDQCEAMPCQNGATCMDQVNAYTCICSAGFEGRNCTKEVKTYYGCLYENGGCEHFCVETLNSSHVCLCASGYRLAPDKSSCLPQVEIPCGKVVSTGFSPRIVRGEVCPKGECPWQAMLEHSGQYQCGAIILDAQWILTAAHCIWKISNRLLQITVGEHIRKVTEGTEQTRGVAKVLMHPDYNHTTKDSDLALLRLRSPITLNSNAVPICLPPKAGTFGRTLASIRLSTVSGWGRLAESGPPSAVLQRLEVPRVPQQECLKQTGLRLTGNMLCAGFKEGGRDSCQGDSGGPLVTRYKNTSFLLGIVSWGKGCAESNFYGIYTRVSSFLEWIESNMAAT